MWPSSRGKPLRALCKGERSPKGTIINGREFCNIPFGYQYNQEFYEPKSSKHGSQKAPELPLDPALVMRLLPWDYFDFLWQSQTDQ